MTREEKWELGIGAGIVAIVLVVAYIHGKNSGGSSNSTPLTLPTIGNSGSSTGSVTLPSISVSYQPGAQYSVDVAGNNVSTGNGTLCSCGCNTSAAFFDMGQLLSSYATALQNDTNSYLQTLLSSIPATIQQFVNNPTGYEQAASIYSLVDMLT